MTPTRPVQKQKKPHTTRSMRQEVRPTHDLNGSSSSPPSTSSNDTSTSIETLPALQPRQLLPPTTHDPTVKPPWKKHRLHRRPPTADWALLWPRPESWECPPGASKSSLFAGCKYLEPPLVFDPEIEGLPDWIGSKGADRRLWSGMDRAVVVEEGEGGGKVVKRAVPRGVEEGLDWDDEMQREAAHGNMRKAVFYIPQPHIPKDAGRHQHHSIERHQQYPSIPPSPTPETTPTSTSTPTSTAISTSAPRPPATPIVGASPLRGEPPSFKDRQISNALWGVAFPVSLVVAFVFTLFMIFWTRLARRRKLERIREEARARARGTWGGSTESATTLTSAGEREELVEAREQGEDWNDVVLR